MANENPISHGSAVALQAEKMLSVKLYRNQRKVSVQSR